MVSVRPYYLAELGHRASQRLLLSLALPALLVLLLVLLSRVVRNLFLHPLAAFPGPLAAACSDYRRAFTEVFLRRSFLHQLETLHAKYGSVVRIGPNELHFAKPQAYFDIYNGNNRWDKQQQLYHSFGEDRSSFGFLDYATAKERKDVLNKTFSVRAVAEAEALVQHKVDALCDAFAVYDRAGRSINASRAFRCMTIDVVTSLCFGMSIDALAAVEFDAPIITAMDESMKVFPAFKHFPTFKNAILYCPPWLSRLVSPLTAGLVDLQEILRRHISRLSTRPEDLKLLPHNRTIFHTLMSPEAHDSGAVPPLGSLYEESQALMFGGGDTTGNALMVTTFHLLKRPAALARLKAELRKHWPHLHATPPSSRRLETLPYLNAVIREGLRMSLGVVGCLPRVVPAQGATIAGTNVPGGTVVSCASKFVHWDPTLFPEPDAFRPERWLEDTSLKEWLVAFSRGPRSCLGINLAWVELRLTMANVFRRFDVQLDTASPAKLEFRDAFLPLWTSQSVLLRVQAAKD